MALLANIPITMLSDNNFIETKVILCAICMCPPDDPINLCHDTDHLTCKECLISYITNKIETSYLGMCPDINCPFGHADKKHQTLNYNGWCNIVDTKLVKQYSLLADSLMLFLCGKCHTLKTIDVGFSATVTITDIVTNDLVVDCYNNIRKYDSGTISLDEIYELLTTKYIPDINSSIYKTSWSKFKQVLCTIANPARRVYLYLRYLKYHPFIKTLCCNKEHCFTCKTIDFHTGQTCESRRAQSATDDNIVDCPDCGIILTKGDGCNTITCVCTKQFTWTTEVKNYKSRMSFLEKYPFDTNKHCAKILCNFDESAMYDSAGLEEFENSQTWFLRNIIQIRQFLKEEFKLKFPFCPSQCCIVMDKKNISYGILNGLDAWKIDNGGEVKHLLRQRDIAIESIFPTLYARSGDFIASIEASKLVNYHNNSVKCDINIMLINSAKMWIKNNQKIYKENMEVYKIAKIKQFLIIYGNRNVLFSKIRCDLTKWDLNISNSDLTYTNDGRTVERIDCTTPYPACFTKLIDNRSYISIIIETDSTHNYTTFGVVKKGFPTSCNRGVGKALNSWGIIDDGSNGRSIIYENGRGLFEFDQLEIGDIISGKVDILEEYFELYINKILIHKFTINFNALEDYYFAMTIADDHRVSIIDVENICRYDNTNLTNIFNNYHQKLYKTTMNYIKDIFTGELLTDIYVDANLSQKWLEICEDDGINNNSKIYFDIIKKKFINSISQNKLNQFQIELILFELIPFNLTWNTLMYALHWYIHNETVTDTNS
jgi:hypothetical protein